MSLDFLIGGLMYATPLVGWIVAIVLAVAMLRRGGGRAERLLVTGISLMLVNSFILVLTLGITSGLWDIGVSPVTVFQLINTMRILIGLAGIVCLVYAFWIKFKVTSHA